MAFAPGYENDVFISYAHNDDAKAGTAEVGWVSFLTGQLQVSLDRKLGERSAKIWRDAELAKNKRFSTQIYEALSQTATMVVVLTNSYVKSHWCTTERDSFLGLVEGWENGRVFVVKPKRFEDDDPEPPHEFSEHLGYDFWVMDPGSKRPRQLGYPKLLDIDAIPYNNVVEDLARDISGTLCGLVMRGHEVEPEPPEPEEEHVVYLALTTDDLMRRRGEVGRYLAGYGIRVVPVNVYPISDFEERARKDLKEARAFIQLLGPNPDRFGLDRLQYDLAREVGVPLIIQWRSDELDFEKEVESEEHRAFLTGPDVRAQSLERLKAEVKEEVLRPKRTPRIVPGPDVLVFVDRELRDQELARQVCGVLERHHVGFVEPIISDEPSENRADFEDSVLGSDGVIVVYGQANARWVKRQLIQMKKVARYNGRPLPTLAIYEGPPVPKDPLGIQLPHMSRMSGAEGIDEQAIAAFLRELDGN